MGFRLEGVIRAWVFRILVLGGIISLVPSCARYGMRNDESRQYSKAQITLHSPVGFVEEKLRRFLSERGLLPKMHRSYSGSQVDVECSWIRDTSLDLFYIIAGTRKPHLVHWKAVWRLEPQDARHTRVSLKIMELLYMGAQEDAGATPALNGQWVEAPETHLRDWLELRRFYVETYPSKSLPNEMAILKVPSLDFPPLWLQDTKHPDSQRTPRPFSF